MSPEAKLAEYARRISLMDEDVDYLISLLQEARSLGSIAAAKVEREWFRDHLFRLAARADDYSAVDIRACIADALQITVKELEEG